MQPEAILVLELAGSIESFIRAVKRVPGLEFLGEQVLDDLQTDPNFRVVDSKGKVKLLPDGTPKPYKRQLYLMASDVEAWRQVLGLWRRFTAGSPMPHGLAPFKHLFAQLRSVREWNDHDRLTVGGAADAWLADLQSFGSMLVSFEIELWYRQDRRLRAAARAAVEKDLVSQGGSIDREFVLAEADYHGLLGAAPADKLVLAAQSGEIAWLATQGVRLFHATAQVTTGPSAQDANASFGAVPSGGIQGAPRIALLDGLPAAAHKGLAGRVTVDDPDGWSATVPVARRRHGTMMASLIAHGDLSRGTADSLKEPIYVRPIFQPGWAPGSPESVPAGSLVVELIYSAVARLFETPARAAPDVKVVVLAVGDKSQQFDRFVSPAARLLDWLSWKYQILFLVSGGNHLGDIEVPDRLDLSDLVATSAAIVESYRRDALSKRLLAPAESINALTVGAAHHDASGAVVPSGLVDPLYDPSLPGVVSPVATGVNRSIKPDVLFPGGRQLLREEPRTPSGTARRLSVVATQRPPGVQAAAPPQPGRGDPVAFESGTSCAVGLAGHEAGKVLALLDELRQRHGGRFPNSRFDAVLVKAAIAHAARWGSAETHVRDALTAAGAEVSREAVGRFLGFGRADPSVALEGGGNRVVLVQASELEQDAAHTYQLPLPPSLDTSTVARRLALTVAWLSPTRPRHQTYRSAVIDVAVKASEATLFGTRHEADGRAAGRGTLRHEVLRNDRAIVLDPGQTESVCISCRSTNGDPIGGPIPYALFATIETPDDISIPVFNEVRQIVAPRVPARRVRP